MQKITYLLGAGASANALPTYSNFKQRFQLFYNLVSGVKMEILNDDLPKIGIKALEKDSRFLLKELSFHSTPDTVAKKFFLQGKFDLLKNLKAVLVAFFCFEQTVNNLPRVNPDQPVWIPKPIVDGRYDSFVSQLLSPEPGKLKLQKGINILTWNYDYQFELTCKFFSNKPIDDQNELFISHPSPFDSIELPLNRESFKVLHLNGVAIASNRLSEKEKIMEILGNSYSYDNYPLKILAELYYYLIFDNKELGNSLENHMLFGWEKLDDYPMPREDFYIFNEAKKVCEDTEVLIIIGYSFPVFNQNVDEFLFKNFISLHTLLIQSPDFENISSVLKSDFIHLIPKENNYQVAIQDVGYTNQFFIPRRPIEGKRKAILGST